MEKDKFMNFFCREMVVYRNLKGISQSKLACILGVTRFTIINYENGHRVPDICIGLKIAKILGIKLERIMDNIC